MSTMKNGFSTLNRWLGRKNKEKSVIASNGKLSKSNNNLSLSISTIDINETSQLEYNRITPQPAVTSNAPFEQTFRITVLLPKDQLYVTRLGARVPLSKLLELVCGNKLLNTDKYEFRNPVDASQVFNLKLSIGAVGLSELRLCLKSDPYNNNFNTDDVVKLRQTSGNQDSCSSSEFSSRQSKHTTKTISPYSSSNSLNSLESSSIHYAKVSAPSTPMAVSSPKIIAPPRKKRVAPRPPSQITIHEQTVLSNGYNEPTKIKSPDIILSKKDYYVSTPDLPVTLTVSDSNISKNTSNNMNSKTKIQVEQTKDAFDANELYARVEKKNVRNLYGGSVQNLTSPQKETLPEPSPRKHLVVVKKKSAPAPPSSNGNPFEMEDSISLSPSICESSPLEQVENSRNEKIPKPASRETLEGATQLVTVNNITETVEVHEKKSPIPVPRVNALTSNTPTNSQTNISKVMLNRTPTPEPRSLSSDVGDMDNMSTSQLSESKQPSSCDDEDDNASKQADSGIGEPVPSPVPDSLPSEGGSSAHDFKSNFESSSDDDEMIRVYNFKLGKTVTQPLDELNMLEKTPTSSANTIKTDVEICSGESTPATIVSQSTPCPSETASWNFSIPISPPPNFADDKANKELLNLEKVPDVPITPKIKERPVLDFESLTSETQTVSDKSSQQAEKMNHKMLEKQTSNHSATTPLDEIVDELSAIIQQKGVGSLMRKAELPLEIESAKPNTLGNFSIVNISQQSTAKPQVERNTVEQSPVRTPEEEKLYRKHSNVSARPTLKSITRADSFHTAADVVDAQSTSTIFNGGLNSRSSSYSTLTKLETNGNMGARGKSSSSELSIAESPSLLSLEIMKTILNSRKNSLANSGSDGEDKTEKTDSKPEQIKPKIQEEESKPMPKVYRYSGPPSINLGTWNERPKASIAIKNEGDYIFGGKSATNQNAAVTKAMLRMNTQPQTQQQSHRASMPAFIAQQKAMKSETMKADSPIKRMGISVEEVYRVPITVKPLKDLTVENHEVNTSTLPRSKLHQQSGTNMSISLKRSSSITALEAAKMNKQAEEEKTQTEAPFGQSILRKTGLKEKILSPTEEQKAVNKSEKREFAEINQKNFTANVRKQETSTPRHFNRPMSKFHTQLHVNYQVKTPIAPKSAPAAPIPPPPPLFKPTTTTKHYIPECDPRDQLLDAIRNFKFEQLKRSNSQK